MDYESIVGEVVAKLKLTDKTGRLLPIDSLRITEVVFALEKATGVTIPPHKLDPRRFGTVTSIAALLTETAEARRAK